MIVLTIVWICLSLRVYVLLTSNPRYCVSLEEYYSIHRTYILVNMLDGEERRKYY